MSLSKNNFCPICGKLLHYGSKRCKKHKIVTEATRQKLRLANLGKKQSKETLEKLSKIRKGKTPWNKGKHNPPSQTGKNHPNWKGGITPENMRIRHSIEYFAWRQSIFERDNYTCLICKQHGGKLEAHHIDSFSENPKLRFDINNGITLCKKCHKFLHRDSNLYFLWDDLHSYFQNV